MKMIILALALAGCIRWSKADTARELAFVATQAVDYDQTLGITHHCVENNPMIGRCGDGPISIAPYFIGTTLLHAAVSIALSSKWRAAWQYVTIGVGGATAVNDAVTLGHFK